ncbi:fluoride efflux transporter CrcB [Deinococcus yavapaiensis]|uniref:Fluoride-specific ion channel FluC n=1 Tax=Deinococcus yavapaiensis KR-236 TaxID=694435 RepID=A0A318S8C3_9DEIO|nr:fluoride efflux transporter CrcB [Deinococcus yavapaiensis]PYE55277.1 camphor resistance protein CrcB [Deinococcus yavapaiensis KR-236]
MWWGIALGGALGAVARFALGAFVAARSPLGTFPLSTLVINVLGSFALGLLLALVGRGTLSDAWRLWIGVGFLGAFTTFSTFSVEVDGLLRRGAWTQAFAYVSLSVGLGFGAAVLGRMAGER